MTSIAREENVPMLISGPTIWGLAKTLLEPHRRPSGRGQGAGRRHPSRRRRPDREHLPRLRRGVSRGNRVTEPPALVHLESGLAGKSPAPAIVDCQALRPLPGGRDRPRRHDLAHLLPRHGLGTLRRDHELRPGAGPLRPRPDVSSVRGRPVARNPPDGVLGNLHCNDSLPAGGMARGPEHHPLLPPSPIPLDAQSWSCPDPSTS